MKEEKKKKGKIDKKIFKTSLMKEGKWILDKAEILGKSYCFSRFGSWQFNIQIQFSSSAIQF